MPITIPSLDDRDFEDLYRELLARVPVHTPEWTNLGDSDPGTTLLQLFAFLADNISYRSNRIPEATRHAFLTLLGAGLRPPAPATGFVQYSVDGRTVVVPSGAVVRAGKVEFRTRRSVNVVPVEAHVFWKRRRTDLEPAVLDHLRRLHEPFLGPAGVAQLDFYDSVEIVPPRSGVDLDTIDLADPTTGPIDGSVWVALTAGARAVRTAGGDPAAAVAALRPTLAGATVTLAIVPAARREGRVLEPHRIVAPPPGGGLVVDAPAPGAMATYQRLDVTYADDVLERPGVIDVRLPALGQLIGPWDTDPSQEGTSDLPPLVQDRELAARIVTWLRVRRRAAASAPVPSGGAAVSWLGINAASVVQAVRVVRERIGDGTGAPDQRFSVAHPPVLVGDPERAPVLEVLDEAKQWQVWTLTDSLESASADDRVWAVDPESGVVAFGSGFHGARPPVGSSIRLTYEYGGGPQGVVPIGAIDKLDGAELAEVSVTNPLPTVGGSAGETQTEAERSIPAWLRHRDRAVTAADFRDIALRTPGVDLGRVDVLPLFDPRPDSPEPDPSDAAGTVTVMVVPVADGHSPNPPSRLDPHVLDAVCSMIEPRRLITTRVFVRGASWVHVVVSVGIALLPGEVREEVERRVRSALADHLSPLTGGVRTQATGITVEASGASPTGWPLATDVRVDDLAAAATRVAGVRYVEGVRLAGTRNGSTIVDAPTIGMTGLELPVATVHVTVGPPDDPATLLAAAGPGTDSVPVPVIPRRC